MLHIFTVNVSASSNGVTGLLGLFLLSPVMQSFGRKATHICLNVADLIGWLILPFANSIRLLFIARLIQGLSKGGVFINGIIISEYADPKRRGYFMTIKKCCVAAGALICHSMALYFDWRQISMLGIVPSALAIVFTLYWPESPSYYAMKGRFEDCERSFLWLHGDATEKRHELRNLMAAQAERLEKKKNIKRNLIKKLMKKFLMKDFLKALLLALLLTIVVDICGRYYFVAYVIQIMIELVGDKSAAVYCSIAGDILTVTALVLSCFIVTSFKRRTVVFSFGIASTVLMFLISFVVFLKSKYTMDAQLKWLTPCLILFLIVIINIGIVPIAFTIAGEVFPLEHRGFGSCISGIGFMAFYVLTMKVTPIMLETMGLQGTYAIFGLCLLLCLLVLYYVLPETKDRTLQDIEDEMKNYDRSVVELEPILTTKIDRP